MRRSAAILTAMVLGLLAAGGPLEAQETPTPAAPADEKPAEKEKPAYRPIESNVIINLPSVEVPREGTLTFLVTHRFQEPIQDGNINNFFTLDTENKWGFGLWYAPTRNLNIGGYRSSNLNVYEASVQYELPSVCGFGSSLRAGGDWRTDPGASSPRSSFFAQAILAYSFGPYVRFTAVPTYLQRTNGAPTNYIDASGFVWPPPPRDPSCRPNAANWEICSGSYKTIFNVPVALSIALTHSITVHGEVIPRLSRVDSSGVGWSVTVDKSLLRHRFAFFAGNQRQTTVDQYLVGVPYSQKPNDVYIGFNLYRAWKLK
jgi:hypothetical protein